MKRTTIKTMKYKKIIIPFILIFTIISASIFAFGVKEKHASAAVAADANSTTPCVASPAPAQWKHVVVLMFENKTYSNVIGSTSAPYISNLASKCGTAYSGSSGATPKNNWHDGNYKVDGTTDGNYVSKPSYATLTSGVPPSVHGLKDDTYSTTSSVDNIYNRLNQLGKDAKDYYSGTASTTPCASSNFSGAYHDAMRYYTNLGGQSTSTTTYCNTHDKPLSTFMTDVNNGTLPAFSLILPTNGENMHDNTVTSGDTWAQNFLTPLFDSAQYKSGDTAVFFLWDEDTAVPNVLAAPSIVAGSKVAAPSGNPISHFSALRTWQEMLGITSLLGDTAQAPSLLSFFNGGGTPPVDNPPAVNVTAPTAGTTVSTSPITVSANATDDYGLSKVEFYDNGILIGSDTTAPYSASWNTSTLTGSHSLTAKAFDTANQSTISSAISVTVSITPSCPNDISGNGDTAITTASVTSPGPYNFWVRMRAADTTNNSLFVKVDSNCAEIIGDSTSMAANSWQWVNYKNGATTSPYSLSLSTGSHTVTLARRENNVDVDRVLFLSDNCVPTNLGTNCTDTTPPTVSIASISSPSGSTTVSGNVTINANASDTETGISKVEFLVDGNVVNTSTTSPYTYTWNSKSVGDGSHTIAARATDGAGNTATTANTTVTVKNADTTAPSAPTNLATTNVAYNQVALQWTASTDNVGVTSYTVLRSGSPVGTVTSGTTFTDTTVTPNTSYTYTVTASDAARNTSSQSNIVSVTTPQGPDTSPPTAPTNLATTSVAYNNVALKWTGSTDNVGVTAYLIVRNGAVMGSTTTGITTFNDVTVSPNTSYSYYIIARDAAGNNSPASNTITVLTPNKPDTTAPSTPTNLTGNAVSGPQVNLYWTPSTDNVGVTGYEVWCNSVKIGTSTTNDFGDASVSAGQTYSYSVLAFDAAGNKSAASTSISVTIPNNPVETITIAPSDDATVNSRYPNRNFGTRGDLYTDANRSFYMKFNVAGIKGRTVLSAQLQLLQKSKKNNLNPGINIYPVSSNSWTETSITLNNAPAAGSTAVGSVANGTQGTWITSSQLNSFIIQDGIYSMKFSAIGSKYTSGYNSLNSTNKPQLVLTVQ